MKDPQARKDIKNLTAIVEGMSQGKGVTNLDHGGLAGLSDDDHTQYRLESADHSHQSTGLQGGKLDHGLALDGLADDDHTQYIKHSLATAVNDFLVASGASAFVKKTLVEVKAILDWAADIATHAALPDSHHARLHGMVSSSDHSAGTLGDIICAIVAGAWSRLAGNTTTTKKFLSQTGTSTVSAVPVWDTIADGDVPATHSGSAHHTRSHSIVSTADHTSTATAGKMLKADASGLPVEASNTDTDVADAVTKKHANTNDPTADEKAALAGTSGAPSVTNKYVTDADSRNTNSRTPSGSAGGELAGTYPNPTVVATHSGSAHHARAHAVDSGSDHSAGTLGDVIYAAVAGAWAKLTGNTTTTRKFLRQTGTGAASAAPAWDTIVGADIPAIHGGNPGDAHSDYQLLIEKGAVLGYASLNGASRVVQQPAAITDHLEASPTNGLTTKAPNSDWAYDHNANVDAHHTRSHLITSTSDHGPTGLTASQLLRLNAGATAIESSGKVIGDFEASGATATHAALATGIHGVGASTIESIVGSQTKVDNHAALADPHTGYRLESADHTHQSAGLQGGKINHGLALDGVTADQHHAQAHTLHSHTTGKLVLPGGTELTLDVGGAITVTGSKHYVDTYSDAATDNLDVISGGTEGYVVILGAQDVSRIVTVRHQGALGAGSLHLKNGQNFVLDTYTKFIVLQYAAGTGGGAWSEIGRSDSTTGEVTNGDDHNHVGGDGAQIDHGGQGGLADDDHTQYAKITSGTYTGNGIDGTAKEHGLGRVPKAVLIGTSRAGPYAGIAMLLHPSSATQLYVGIDAGTTTFNQFESVTAPDSTYFYVDASIPGMNVNLQQYYWVAIG